MARRPHITKFTIETGERFGRLVSIGGRGTGHSQEKCFEHFYGAATPCDECPLLEPPRSGVFVTTPSDAERPPLLMVVHDDGARAEVTAVEIDAKLSHDVVRAWIARLEQSHELSAQERSVLELLVLGRTHREIGLVLGIAPRTVRFHQTNLLEKLGAESRSDLMRLLMGADVPARIKSAGRRRKTTPRSG